MSMKNPWQTLSCKTVYDNPWIRVEHREVIAPTGAAGIYGLVHMKNLALGIVPVDDQGQTWLVGQYRYATECYSWEIPMGGGPEHESPLQAAQRELAEETGLAAERWQEILSLQTTNCVSSERALVFLATGIHPVEGHSCDETEALQVRKLPLVDAIDMAMSGEISDAVSVAALLKISRLPDLAEMKSP